MCEPNAKRLARPGQPAVGGGSRPAPEATVVYHRSQRPTEPYQEQNFGQTVKRVPRGSEVRLVADSTLVAPIETGNGIYRFVVPQNIQSVSLKPWFAIQTDAPQLVDGHNLGWSLVDITIRSDQDEVVIAADDPRMVTRSFDTGVIGTRIWRWTDGAAEIPWISLPGPALVTVRCAPTPESSKFAPHPNGAPRTSPLISGDTPPPAADEAMGTHWCLGMYSSGSTWVFNSIRLVADTLFPGKPHAGVYAESAEQLPEGWSCCERFLVKSHHTDETATALLCEQAGHIWLCIRDPRDCVASAWTHIFADFDSALAAVTRSALHCERFLHDSRSVLLRYEEGFIDNPATLDRFAQSFSRVLSSQARDKLFRQTRRTAIETVIRGLGVDEMVDDGFGGHRVHMPTQWHTHHLNRTGEVGRWRHELDATQILKVEQTLGPWMERFGYLP